MRVKFHPVFDNPVRMGYLPGWTSVGVLVERLGDLEHAVGEGKIVPARWEPYYQECPSGRHAGSYRWARGQLQNPAGFAQALALFPGEDEQVATRIGHANMLILRTKAEPSNVTRKLMLSEALGLWEHYATDWLEKIVETCAALGVETSVASLEQQVRAALEPLSKDLPPDDDGSNPAELPVRFQRSHGFDKELLHMDGWTPDPGPCDSAGRWQSSCTGEANPSPGPLQRGAAASREAGSRWLHGRRSLWFTSLREPWFSR